MLDVEQNRYENLNLTIAQHPSETTQRMMARLLAYCLNAGEGLSFSRGLSDTSEPDIWQRSLDGRTCLWIEVGEPSVDRLRRAGQTAERVSVYSFNSKSDTWWRQHAQDIQRLGAQVYQFDWPQICRLADLVERTLQLSVTITGQSAFISADTGSTEVTWQQLSA